MSWVFRKSHVVCLGVALVLAAGASRAAEKEPGRLPSHEKTLPAFSSMFEPVGEGVAPAAPPRTKSRWDTPEETRRLDARRANYETVYEPEMIDGQPDWDVTPEALGMEAPPYWSNGGGHRGRFVVGAEYLLVRPHFSDARAMIRRFTLGPSEEGVTQEIDEFIYFNYGYESSIRTYAAYRLDDCCSEIRFTYWRLNGDSTTVGTAGPNSEGGEDIFTIWELSTPLEGDTLTATNDVRGDVYDIDFSRCIRLGDCDPCCGCPRWDLRWQAGVRIADWGYDTSIVESNQMRRVDISQNFTGAGPRVGLQGRRYVGMCGQWSLYANWGMALLVGQWDHHFARTTPLDPAPNQLIEIFRASNTRLVPVTEIEMGAAWQPAPRWTVSAGWFFQCWWDLGQTEDSPSDIGGLPFFHDDANIMSWDGLTLRAEFAF